MRLKEQPRWPRCLLLYWASVLHVLSSPNGIGFLFPFFFFFLVGAAVIGDIVFLKLCINDHFDKGTKALILIGTVFEIKVTAIITRTWFPGDWFNVIASRSTSPAEYTSAGNEWQATLSPLLASRFSLGSNESVGGSGLVSGGQEIFLNSITLSSF